MSIKKINIETKVCPCGCDQEVLLYKGELRYGTDSFVNFAVSHMEHCSSGPHVWLVLGTGSWFANDDRNCWVTLHLHSDGKDIATRISDPEDSPFWRWRTDDDRYLTRQEVLAQDGGKEWAINRRIEFEEQHRATTEFLIRPVV